MPGRAVTAKLTAVRLIGDNSKRALAFAELTPQLPDELRTEALNEALATARAIGDHTERARTLAALAPHLPFDLVRMSFEMVLEDAPLMVRKTVIKVFSSLCSVLSANRDPEFLDEFLKVIRDAARWFP
jgi:hypothetical protein